MNRWVQLGFAILGFKIVWLGCVLGAAEGKPWLGPILLVFFAAWQLKLATNRPAELLLMAIAAIAGFTIDSGFSKAGILEYASPVPWEGLAPVWIVAMWINFALILTSALRWMRRRHAIAAVFGIIGGPLAYWTGANLGAANMLASPLLGYGLLGVAWGVAVPVLVHTAAQLEAAHQ